MRPFGKGPLLSASDVDLRILWRRVAQIGEINRRMRETVQVCCSLAMARPRSSLHRVCAVRSCSRARLLHGF